MKIDTEKNDKIYNLKLQCQNDRDIEIQMESKSTLGDLLQRIDDLTKVKESWTHYTVGNTRLILNGASMENALITDKYDMKTSLDNMIGLADGSVLTLAQGQSNRNRNREVYYDSPAYSNLAQFRTLVPNVRACNQHAQWNQESTTRIRFDAPDLASLPSQPSKLHSYTLPFNQQLEWKGLFFDSKPSCRRPWRSTRRILDPTIENVTYTC